MSKLAGKLTVFKGDDTEVEDADVVVELCNFLGTGFVEIGYGFKGRMHYVKFSLPQLLSEIATQNGSDGE